MAEEKLGSVLRLHLLDDDPKGPRVLEATHRNTKAIVTPRSSYEHTSETLSDFRRPGVYVLVYPEPESAVFSERVYIGQADVAKDRIDVHHRDPKKDWTLVALFTSKDGALNNVHAQFLEARLVALAKIAGRAQLENKVSPQEPTLDPADRDIASRFLHDIILYSPALGINAFEAPRSLQAGPTQIGGVPEPASDVRLSPTSSATSPPLYHLDSLPGARGLNTADGFVVFAGSPLRAEVAPSANERAHVGALRSELRKNGIIGDTEGSLKFLRDHVFNSPSQAAIVLLGYPVSGRAEWKIADGRSLNEVEATEPG